MRVNTVVKCLLTTAPMIVAGLMGFGQDTTKKKTIDITSSFKPVLKEGSKINFNAAPPVADTSRPRLNYTIPAQNLLFTYVPTELKPVAIGVDSGTAWKYSNYIKVGVGNVHLPYVKAGFSFGDGKNTFYNLYGEHYTSKGDLPFQKNSLTSVGGAITYKTRNNHEWNGSLGFKSDDYFFYGYQPTSLVFTKDQLRQRFQTIEGKVNFRNTVPSEFGLTYSPSLRVSVFADNHSPTASEANAVLNVPVTKTFGETFAFKLGLNADLTNFRVKSNDAIQNNIYMVSPAVTAKTPNLYLNVGILPSWDNGDFHMLPNLTGELTTDDQRFTFMAGWIGYYNKASYERFASVNPWISLRDSIGTQLRNDRVNEIYVGIKGSLGDHFTYLGKVGVQQHRNMALYVNDGIDGKTFNVIYEPRVDVLQLHGEVAYTVAEKFSAKGGITFNNFTRLKDNPKAYGQLPRELNLSLKYKLLKDLWLTSELYSWDGAYYRMKPSFGSPNVAEKGDAAFDLNAGAEFRITKNFNLWIQMNNIFNNKYERWNQYEVFGFNILGGITYSF